MTTDLPHIHMTENRRDFFRVVKTRHSIPEIYAVVSHYDNEWLGCGATAAEALEAFETAAARFIRAEQAKLKAVVVTNDRPSLNERMIGATKVS